MKTKKLARIFLVAALCLTLIGSLFAYLVQTNFGGVKIYDVSFVTDTGVMTGLVYKPKAATKTDKKPAVVLSHGYLNSREMQDMAAIELSRRGFVVFAMDAYGHGHSTAEKLESTADLYPSAGGMWDAVDYVYNLQYVDKTKIAVGGHSMGGIFANLAVMIDNGYVAAGAPRRISAVLLMGSSPQVIEGGNFYGTRSVGVVAGKYDEFFFEEENAKGKDTPVHYLESKAARDFVNVFDDGDVVAADAAVKNGLKNLSDAVYTGTVEGTADVVRAIYQPSEIHPWNHFSTRSAKAVINFFGNVASLRPSNYLNSYNTSEASQTWWLKEMFNFFALIGFFLFLISLVLLMLELPFLKKLNASGPALSAKKPKDLKTNLVYWINFGLTIVLSAITFLGIMTAVGKGESLSSNANSFFTQPTTNEISVWAVVSGGIALALFTIGFFVNNKFGKPKLLSSPAAAGTAPPPDGEPEEENTLAVTADTQSAAVDSRSAAGDGAGTQIEADTAEADGATKPANSAGGGDLTETPPQKELRGKAYARSLFDGWGVTDKWYNVLLCLAVAFAAVFASYVLLYFVDYFWHTDFRIWTIAVKTFEPYILTTSLKYVLLFAVYFVVSSFTVNHGVCTEGRREIWNYLLAIAVTVGGALIIVAIQYLGFFMVGYRPFQNQTLRPILAFALIPLLAVSAVITRMMYRKTGKIWLGAFLNTLLFTIITCANTLTMFY